MSARTTPPREPPTADATETARSPEIPSEPNPVTSARVDRTAAPDADAPSTGEAAPELPALTSPPAPSARRLRDHDGESGTPRAVVSVQPRASRPAVGSATTELDLETPSVRAVNPDTIALRRVTLLSDHGDAPEVSAPKRGPEAYVGYIIDGRYHVEALLAQGGMGVVYRGRHRLIDKPVAIKVLRPELADNREITQRFLTEARAASSIGNDHIVDITDFGELPDGATYIVMEFLEGRALARRIKDEAEPISIPEILNIARQVTEGLEHAHEAGIVHRDLKPDNIFLTERKGETFVKILDFGIAKVLRSQNEKTRAGRIFGTPHYMSPEQAKGEELDNRSDIYALGVILYEMVSGRLPFDAENPLGILTQHMYNEPTPLSQVCSMERLSVGLEAVIAKCLMKEPWRRYGSMRELDEDLARVENNQSPLAIEDLKRHGGAPTSLRERLDSEKPRARPRLGLWAFLMLLVGGGVATAIALGSGERLAALRAELFPGAQATVTASSPETTTAPEDTAPTRGDDSRDVALVLSPVDARVYRGNKDLGMMPITLRIPSGQRTVLSVRREGYASKRVEVDGSEGRIVVELSPLPGTSPQAPSGVAVHAPSGESRVVTILDAGSDLSPSLGGGEDDDAGPASSGPVRDALDAGVPAGSKPTPLTPKNPSAPTPRPADPSPEEPADDAPVEDEDPLGDLPIYDDEERRRDSDDPGRRGAPDPARSRELPSEEPPTE